jgi:predicted RNA-binding protein YlqC (UPF0109 family)
MDNSIDQQFVEYVVKSLVGKPDEVKVERSVDEKGVLLELTVDPEDLGRVIGKRGATAQSLRTLLRALGTKNDARYNLKIVDNGEPRPERDSVTNAAPATPTDATDDTSKTPPPQDDDLDEDNEVSLRQETPAAAGDRVSQTRKELEDLDDLDI